MLTVAVALCTTCSRRMSMSRGPFAPPLQMYPFITMQPGMAASLHEATTPSPLFTWYHTASVAPAPDVTLAELDTCIKFQPPPRCVCAYVRLVVIVAKRLREGLCRTRMSKQGRGCLLLPRACKLKRGFVAWRKHGAKNVCPCLGWWWCLCTQAPFHVPQP